jgi:hypothetical protein
MSRGDKLREKILSGKSDGNIRFAEICKFVESIGFTCRPTDSSHHVYFKSGVVEIFNLQDDGGGKAKKYQIKQIRSVVEKYDL